MLKYEIQGGGETDQANTRSNPDLTLIIKIWSEPSYFPNIVQYIKTGVGNPVSIDQGLDRIDAQCMRICWVLWMHVTDVYEVESASCLSKMSVCDFLYGQGFPIWGA